MNNIQNGGMSKKTIIILIIVILCSCCCCYLTSSSGGIIYYLNTQSNKPDGTTTAAASGHNDDDDGNTTAAADGDTTTAAAADGDTTAAAAADGDTTAAAGAGSSTISPTSPQILPNDKCPKDLKSQTYISTNYYNTKLTYYLNKDSELVPITSGYSPHPSGSVVTPITTECFKLFDIVNTKTGDHTCHFKPLNKSILKNPQDGMYDVRLNPSTLKLGTYYRGPIDIDNWMAATQQCIANVASGNYP